MEKGVRRGTYSMHGEMLLDWIERIMGRVPWFNPVKTVKILWFLNRQIIYDYYGYRYRGLGFDSRRYQIF